MKIEVRMLTSMSGDPQCNHGDTIKVDPKVAQRWEERGLCEIIRQTKRARSKKAVKRVESE